MEEWHILSVQLWDSFPNKRHQDCLMPTAKSLSSALTYYVLFHTSTRCQCTSLYVTSFTKPSPAFVMQATNTGVSKLGTRLLRSNNAAGKIASSELSY